MGKPTKEEAIVMVKEFVEEAKNEWSKMVENSGMSQAVFVMCSSDATQFLGRYKITQDAIKEEYGIIVPDLFEGLTVEVTDCG